MRRLTGALAAAAALLAAAPATAQTRPDSDQPWREFQWLYGSAEGAATSRQAFNALRAFAVIQAERWRMGEPVVQRVLAPGATLDRPAFESCGDKKPAVVFDIDETLLLNTGAEYWAAAKQQSYEQSRLSTRMPGPNGKRTARSWSIRCPARSRRSIRCARRILP